MSRALRYDTVATATLTIASGGWAIGWVWPSLTTRPAVSAACVAVTMAFVAAGIFGWREPHRRTAGVMFALAGVLSPLNSAVGWDWGPLPFIRGFTEGIFWIALLWSLLSCQDRLIRPLEKLFLAYLWVYFIAGQLALDLVSKPQWQNYPAASWWPSSFPDRAKFETVTLVLNVGAFVGAVGLIAVILSRRRQSSILDRHYLSPIAIASVIASLVAATAWAAAGTVTVVEQLFLFTIPVAFLISTIRMRLLHSQLSTELVKLARTPTLAAVEEMLQTALRDPTVAVYYWIPEKNNYVNHTGKPVDLHGASAGRMTVPVTSSDGRPLAVVSTDICLSTNRDYVETAVRTSGFALENARLHAVIHTQLQSIREVQSQVVQIALEERRRLERNLHDGAQQRLLSVATSIGLATTQTDETQLQTTLSKAASELQHALHDLRELARGLHPAILTSEGLAAAIQVVADRLPTHIRVDIEQIRLPPAVEATAYYVICEAMTNIVKHSQAHHATVTARVYGPQLHFQISDDGVGGANLGGDGISGMRARVLAMGGSLRIHSDPLSGTQISGWLPRD